MKETNIYKITKIYSKKEFKEFKKNLEKKDLKPIILGNININKKYKKEDIKDNKDIVYVKEDEKKEKKYSILDDEKLSNINVSKYGYIGNEEFLPLFIQVKRSPIIFFIWFLLMLIGLLSLLLLLPCPNRQNREPLEIANGTQWDGENPQNGEITQPDSGEIEIPCYFDLTLKKDEPLKLINPKGNDVYFVYTISENGKEVYKSKALKPDNMILSRLPKFLSIGEHNLIFDISTYDIKNQTPCNGAVLDVKLIVKESSFLENSNNIKNTESKDIYLIEKDGKYYLPEE